MVRYILHRIAWSIPVFVAVSLITFALMHLAPGGPGCTYDCPRPLSPETKQAFLVRYGLDKPLPEQYIIYVVALLHGDLGLTYEGTRTVNRIIADEFPLSAAFGVTALAIGILTGIPFGLVCALRRNSLIDRLGTILITISTAVPNFVLAIVLILIFAVNLHLVSVQFQRGNWQSWILPLLLLAVRLFAVMVRLTRGAVLDILGEDYIRTARMKGLTQGMIYFRHVLRNALLPTITILGPLAADVLTGSFVIESIFGIPGLGRTFVTSIVSRDYALLMGVTLFFALILIIFNLLVDVSYTFIDPRISYR